MSNGPWVSLHEFSRLQIVCSCLAVVLFTAGWRGECKPSDADLYKRFVQLKEDDPLHFPAKAVALRELWNEAALDEIFKDSNELLFFENYMTAYGKGISGTQDAPVIEAIASIPRQWYSHYHGKQGIIDVKELSKPGEAAPGCSFDASRFETVILASSLFATRDIQLVFYMGFARRVSIAQSTSALMETMGFPGISFIELPHNGRFLPGKLAGRRFGLPTMSCAISLKIAGPCAVPFTLEKQTALRVSLNNLLGPVINVFHTAVKQVTETVVEAHGTQIAVLRIVIGMFSDPRQPDYREVMKEITTGANGLSPLHAELETLGLDISAVTLEELKLLDGNPPETYDEWWEYEERVLKSQERAMDFVKKAVAVMALLLGGLGYFLATGGTLRSAPQVLTAIADAGSETSTVSDPLPPSRTASTISRTSTWSEQDIASSDLEILQGPDNKPWLLGSGAFGTVYKGLREGVHEVAIKVLTNSVADVRRHQSFMREVELLKSCRHSHIVQFQGLSFVGDDIWLVMEYMVAGDLFGALCLGDEWMWYGRGAQIALDVACGLAYLHRRNVIHLDLKSANILLTKDGRAKVGDVGLCHLMASRQTHASLQDVAGTFNYIAPEVILQGQASCKADIFSYGVVLWEIVTGELPRRGCLRQPKVPDECPQEIADLLAACLMSEPAERPSASQIVLLLREHLGTARQATLPLQMPDCRLQRQSDQSFTLDRTAEQMSMRGAEVVQWRAQRLGTRHTIDFADNTVSERPQRIRGWISLPGPQTGPSMGVEDFTCSFNSAARDPDAFEEALNVFQEQGVMASPFAAISPLYMS